MPPGISVGAAGTAIAADTPIEVRWLRYDPAGVEERRVTRAAQLPPLAGAAITWLAVEQVSDVQTLASLSDWLRIHPLAVEDAVNPSTPPKAEAFEDQLYLSLKRARLAEGQVAQIELEQISLVLGPGWVLSMQEQPSDVFDALRSRIQVGNGRIRRRGADYLAHALLDVVVDGYFVVLERLEEDVLALEEEVLQVSLEQASREVYRLRGELIALRRVVRPLPGLIAELQRAEGGLLQRETLPYLRDLQDHVRHVTELVDMLWARLGSVLDLHLAMTSHRMNEVMKLLTLVATIFIPLTFIAGIYGMNFSHMPELGWRWGYPVVLLSMLGVGGGMALWFRRRGWL